MSIHWTLIAGFLYAEIGKNATTKTISGWDKSLGTVRQKFKWLLTGTILLLLVPFISTKMWNKVHYILMSLVLSFLFDVLCCLLSFFPLHSLFQVFKSRFLRGLESQLIYYFYVLVSIFQLGPDLYFSRCSRMRISHVFPSGGNFNTLLPGRHQGDAEVQRWGDSAENGESMPLMIIKSLRAFPMIMCHSSINTSCLGGESALMGPSL